MATMDFVRAQEEKAKRVRDAQEMYQSIVRNCEKSNEAIPPYDFIELIGKGAFGRVYKCRSQSTGNLVAVKITTIDEEDYRADFDRMDENIRDFKKEVSILQQLKDSKTKNVNVIHDAFDLHSQLWIVADYCTGGSVRTLMRPFQREHAGLEEKYIIPIARELIVALKGMHDIGIIHRDVKCANVYVTEDGDIQLGDFGIVGVLDDGAASKRKTIVGTPHWMPKEIVDVMTGVESVEKPYGTEIDIWSYGCTIYEMAAGAPPNNEVQVNQTLARRLENAPRLEGDQYSSDLKDLVAFCLNPDQHARPTAEAILKHPFIVGTSKRYPTSNLIKLIENFKVWEYGGGSRSSLWLANPHDLRYLGADSDEDEPEGIEEENQSSDGWNFSTSESFDEKFGKRLSMMFDPQTFELEAPPGSGLPPLKTKNLPIAERIKREHKELAANRGEKSLERLFKTGDYQLHTPIVQTPLINTPVESPGQAPSDLPLRNYTNDAPTRESMIDIVDLDLAVASADLANTSSSSVYDFGNDLTVKGPSRDNDDEDTDYYEYGQSDDKRATMEWSFPSQAAKKRDTMGWTFATADSVPQEPDVPNVSMELPPPGSEGQVPAGFRPTLNRIATEPVGHFRDFSLTTPHGGVASASRVDDYRGSMIDLDAALSQDPVDFASAIGRPSTASSFTGSAMTDETSGNPFDLEDDPLQNERDRDRFSYHKQWRSEGGHRERVSRTMGQLPMHARGSSLTSTDPGNDHASMYHSDLQNSLGIGLEHGFSNGHSISEDWPNFSTFDTGTRYGTDKSMARANGFDFSFSNSSNSNGHRSEPSRSSDPSNESFFGSDVYFPEIIPPLVGAMIENSEDQLLEDELARQMDSLIKSLGTVAQALGAYGRVDEAGDDADHRLSDLDVGFESTKEGTEDEDESGPDHNTTRRKPRKIEIRSPVVSPGGID